MATKKEFDKRDYHQELTDKLVAKMESAQNLKWEKPWFTLPPMAPYNVETGTRYSGCNLMSTALSGHNDPRWLTFNGMRSYGKKNNLDLKVRKGEKGTPIFKAFVKEITEDKNGVELDKPRKIVFMAYAGTVFNAEQIDGMPPLEQQKRRDFNPVFAGEQLKDSLVERTKLELVESPRGAWYRPTTHTVGMPKAEHFKSEALYYDTLLHEFGHSTGPALNRKMEGLHGSESYAYEELIAELSSCFMAAELGVHHDQYAHDQNAAYLNSWLKALKDDKNLIFKASNAASRASNYQMEHLREYLYELNMKHTATPQQNELLESIGVPERVLKQLHTEKAEEQLESRQEERAQAIEVSPTPSMDARQFLETLKTEQGMAPQVIARPRPSMGMRM